MTAWERARKRFQVEFGADPSIIASAPGRVNLIGEHTDYNEGFVLPIAVDRRLCVAAQRRSDRAVRILAADFDDVYEFSLDKLERDEQFNWRNYPCGVAWVLQQNGIDLTGMDAVISSDIPIGAGLSSSAAIEVATALALLHFADADVDRKILAQWCQQAENEFVGVRCGIMDQMIALLGEENHALLLDCRDLSHQLALLQEGIAFVVADTGKPRTLAASEYNIRRHQCEEAVRLLSEILGCPLRSLRDVMKDELTQNFEKLPEPVGRRARHVVTENERVHLFVQAMQAGNLQQAGTLLVASHASLRDDYEVSCLELDAMVNALMSVEGVFGARLTGAGFGGACIAMVSEEVVKHVLEEVPKRYAEWLGDNAPTPTLFAVQSSDRAKVEVLR